MSILLYTFITVCGIGAFISGILHMINSQYAPNIYKRMLWVLLGINLLASVLLSNGSVSAILLSGIFLFGNMSMLAVSLEKGTWEKRMQERQCLALLLISSALLLYFNVPMIALALCLVAHFIGEAPIYRKVIQDKKDESIRFWGLFFIASVVGILATDSISLVAIVFPTYAAIFSGSMAVLLYRKNRNGEQKLLYKAKELIKTSLRRVQPGVTS